MAVNPSTSRAECNYHAGLVNQDSRNHPQTSNRESYNTFDKSHQIADTQLFDEVRPFYMDAALSGDVKRMRFSNNDWSPISQSQILTDIHKHRAFFQIPWSVIMPNTWEYLFREPVQGEDINWSEVGPVLTKVDFKNIFRNLFYYIQNGYETAFTTDMAERLIKSVYIFYSIFGKGGLPQTLGVRVCSDAPFSGYISEFTPEKAFQRLCKLLSNDGVEIADGVTFTLSGLADTYGYTPNYAASSSSIKNVEYRVETPVQAYNFIRDFILYSNSGTLTGVNTEAIGGNGITVGDVFLYIFTGEQVETPASSMNRYNFMIGLLDALPDTWTYNIMPEIAYQCLWHQFFTNDRVDPIYNAKSWQSYVWSQYVYNTMAGRAGTFEINGASILYDAFSHKSFNTIISYISFGTDLQDDALDYLLELFTIRPSMRGSDYFTSMRTQPLAVGDVNISVNSNIVSAIDVNKSLWVQRFLNAVNRTKQSIYDYLQSMTGVLPARREVQPNFIAEEVYNLSGQLVENTADSQGSMVSILRNMQSNMMYDVFIDEPSFIIGVDSYSVPYVYPDSCNRIAHMSDRLDWFNDFMQHVGDQSVYLNELYTPFDLSRALNPIGYQLRYAEFKNKISRACGAFISDVGPLKSWLILFGREDFSGESKEAGREISPYMIRNHNQDFDVLFPSLTQTDPTNRYHFVKYTAISENDNSKQQAYPTLL